MNEFEKCNELVLVFGIFEMSYDKNLTSKTVSNIDSESAYENSLLQYSLETTLIYRNALHIIRFITQ